MSPRLRNTVPPTRDKMIIWSAVVAGCGIMALLGRSAAITTLVPMSLQPISFLPCSLFFSLVYTSVLNPYLR